MSERTTLQKIRSLVATQAAKGFGLVGLWLNWNGYRDHPALFSAELNGLGRHCRRGDAAALLNSLWAEHGIATIVHRSGEVRRDLAADRAAWLCSEMSSRIAEPPMTRFRESLETEGPSYGHAVVILADQGFAFDGQSLLDWHHDGHIFRTLIVDADEMLPSGLSSLIGYDSEMQEWISQLEYNLVERWNMQQTQDASTASQTFDALCNAVISQHDPARLRRLAGLPDSGNKKAPLTEEDRESLRRRIRSDLTTPVPIIKEKRLADKNDGVLNWFLPRTGEVSLRWGELMLQCFGNPTCRELSSHSWAVALSNSATMQDRQQMRDNPHLEVAVVTLVSLYCAMRFGNVFAHRGEYEFDLPQYVLEAMLKNELRNLQRIAAAWAP